MGSKCKVIMVLVLLLTLSFVATYIISRQKEKDYSSNLVSALKEHEAITVQDIFPFEFKRAYVFNDCYISGEGFSKRYSLDISIAQVKSGVSESIQRIVFVNEEGFFVHEFKCDSSEIVVSEKGIVIYPETVIERKSSTQEKPLVIYFNSSERYDS